MANRTWQGVVLPPLDLTPCGRLTDTAEKFYLSACEDADRLTREVVCGDDCHMLDIGCGPGRLAIGLRARMVSFARYVGVDVSKSRIDWCVENLAAVDPRLIFVHIDMHNARYNPAGKVGVEELDLLRSSSFDAVNLYSVFSHLVEADVRRYLALIRRVMRPDGACFLTMFVADGVPPVTENPAGFGGLKWSGPLHCVRYSSAHWRALLRESGLAIVREIPYVNVDGQTGFVICPAEAVGHAADSAKRPAAFIGFFGLNRSLAVTLDSIRENIFAPLLRSGFRQVRCAHFNCPQTIENPRTEESGIAPDMSRVHELDLEICWTEPQRDDNIAEYLEDVLLAGQKGERDPTGAVRRNALHQLHSQRRLAQIISTIGASRFDLFCLLRPDLLYIDPIPVDEMWDMIGSQNIDLMTPGWHTWTGLNDRFAVCSRRGAFAYLDRICLVPQFLRERGRFHSESLLKFAAARAHLSCGILDVRAHRVRADGSVKQEDFSA